MTVPLPPDETRRLQALAPYKALGLAPEAAYDRITNLAAGIFHVPVALVTLLDRDCQYFKSHHGTDLSESTREAAICSHAILVPVGEVFVVPDMTLDARFVDNPLVTGAPGIRFYAGAPLRTAAGQPLGSLCLVDVVPRADLTPGERTLLTDLAAMVMETFELRLTRQHAQEEAAERRAAEAEARRAERRVNTVLESIGDGFVLLDREWRFTYINDQAQRMLARPRETLLGRVCWEALPVMEDSTFGHSYRQAVASGEAVHFEEYSPTLQLWLAVSAYPSEEGLSIYFQNIDTRRQARRELEDSHALLCAVIDGTTDAVFLKDHESRYVLINPAGAALLGSTPEEIVGKTDDAFFSPEAAHQTRERDRRVLDTGHSSTHEDADMVGETTRVFLTTKSPYRDAAGNLVGVIGIARETTERHRAAEALRAAKDEAEKANAAKSEFLSRMSHELRTPLNAILGFSQLLELGTLDDHQTESVGHILRAGRHLLTLIDEVLAISRIEAGRMHLSLEPVSLGEITDECLSLVGRLAKDRDVRCEKDCLINEAGCEVHVLADRQRLRQVLLNLLSNAIKYNREGGEVRLSCRDVPALPGQPAHGGAEDGDAPARRVRIEVSDQGPGLTPEDIGMLFVPFERLRAERTSTEGTGLGLALSKGLIEAMNGCIGVDSVPGAGSTFWVELPLADHPLERLTRGGLALPGSGAEPECAGTVLYIEDNLSNLRLIECLLGVGTRLKLLSAQQGTLGLEVARARLPDLILLDLHLPDIPGWEVLAQLRADPATRDIPTIVISADATPKQIEHLHAAGAREYLTKPINVRELLRVLREHLTPAEALAAV